MFGVRFIKVDPTSFVLQYKGGEVVREGTGLSFFYFAPTTALVLVPVGSMDVPFIFKEVTSDFQQVTVQGQLTYRPIRVGWNSQPTGLNGLRGHPRDPVNPAAGKGK